MLPTLRISNHRNYYLCSDDRIDSLGSILATVETRRPPSINPISAYSSGFVSMSFLNDRGLGVA